MPICYHCGQEIFGDPYICNKCGQTYCQLHKEPINHDCDIVRTAVNPYQQPSPTFVPVGRQASTLQDRINRQQAAPGEYGGTSTLQQGRTGSQIRGTTDGSFTWHRQERMIPENAFDPESGIEFKGILLAHKSEFFHLLVGGIIIYIIGLLAFYDEQQQAILESLGYGWAIFMLAGFYTTAFLFHEFGHRQTAKLFGLQTKFRLLTFGMILTIVGLASALMGLFLGGISLPTLALPGAVVVLGLEKVDRKTGLCKAAGPIVNLIYGTILLTISFVMNTSLYPLNMFFGLAAYLNYMLGTFNMIPVGILDGQNIFKWNKVVYILLMGMLVLGLIITLFNIYAPPETSLYFPSFS